MTKDQLIYGIQSLAKSYKGFNLTEAEREMWFSFLQDIDDTTFFHNIKEYIQNNRYPPTIADLRGNYSDDISNEEAWELARKYAYDLHIPKDADPSVVRALNYINIMNLHNCFTERLPFMRQDFIKAYESFKNVKKRDEIKALAAAKEKPNLEDKDRIVQMRGLLDNLGDKSNPQIASEKRRSAIDDVKKANGKSVNRDGLFERS